MFGPLGTFCLCRIDDGVNQGECRVSSCKHGLPFRSTPAQKSILLRGLLLMAQTNIHPLFPYHPSSFGCAAPTRRSLPTNSNHLIPISIDSLCPLPSLSKTVVLCAHFFPPPTHPFPYPPPTPHCISHHVAANYNHLTLPCCISYPRHNPCSFCSRR